MTRVAAVLAIVVGALGAPAAASASPSVELRASRGIGGVVAAGGIDVVTIELVSRADTALELELQVDGRGRPVTLAARGRAAVVLARRVPAGLTAVPASVVRVGEVELEVPAARLVRRPVVMIGDDLAAMVPAVEAWRREAGLGELIAVTPEAVPARWQALVGVGAIVLDRPVATLDGERARVVARHLGAGGKVCRLDVGAVRCAQPAAVAIPRTRTAATIAAVPRALGWLALALALLLGAAALLRRGRAAIAVAVCVIAAAAPLLWTPAAALEVRGVRVVGAADGEDWVAAEVGAAELGELPRLDGDLWIEPAGADQALGPLDDVGLSGRLPGAGSYRVRGFVPGDARWARALTATTRAPVAPP